MEGLTGIHTNYKAWGNGRDSFIVGDKNYRGGKEAWRNSAPTGPVVRGGSDQGRRRRTQPSCFQQVAANGDVGSFLLPGEVRTPGSTARASSSVGRSTMERWRQAHQPPLPPAKGLDTHYHFARWMGMDHPGGQDISPPGRPRSPPVGLARRRLGPGRGLAATASAPQLPAAASPAPATRR
mmetsp:Transcript_25758/g.58665  ORF Transcript_25758/g.58665 Transcript_25758/m.58665 type:complete len:181 (-) Transcript_25758:37-579(-)